MGFLNGAIATGNTTSANAVGSLNFVVAGGAGTTAQAIGNFNSAIAGLGFEGLWLGQERIRSRRP